MNYFAVKNVKIFYNEKGNEKKSQKILNKMLKMGWYK